MDTTTAHPSPAAKKPGLFINRNFGLLWLGQTVSVTGDVIFTFTLVVWIALTLAKGQPWAPLAVSAVLVAEAVPMALIGPLAGVFVDRWDKRRTMMMVDALRAVIVALLLLVTGAVPLPFVPGGRLPLLWQLGAVYATVFLVNALGRFFSPAAMALLGDIVPEEMRSRASGMLQATQSFALIIGPALAPVLFLAFGAEWALLINALSFVVSLLTAFAMKAPPAARSVRAGERGSVLGEFFAGMRFFGSNRVLMTLAIALVIVMLGGGALNALEVFFVTDNLHGSVEVFGLLQSLFGVGLIAGAVLCSVFARQIRAARMLWLSFIGLGIFMVIYSRLTSPTPALVLLGIAGIFNAGVNVAAGPLMLHVTPREFVGRVSAVFNPLAAVASLISIALAGYLVSTVLHGWRVSALGTTFSPVDTIFAVAGLLALIGGLYTMRSLRGVRLAGERGGPSVGETGENGEVGERGAPVAEAVAAD
ncbi:MAG: hypothetical protein OJF49_004444 [Ktedonobacterales bacterium]|nr:MAG: hypothetical protein OJF49_004444 [Ktedonobacterales bacterium]